MTQLVTTTRSNAAKPWTWTYSKLKNFETCPKRHFHVDLQRDVQEEDSESLLWGNQVHTAIAARISKGTPLPRGMEAYEPWCEKILRGAGTILVEQKLALTKDFAACGYYDNDVWYRGVGDVIKIMGPVALAVDWKTGKIIEDGSQLALMAACIFARYPELRAIRTEFIWLKEDASTRADFTREDMPEVWRGLWPRIQSLKQAHDTQSYPAKPGWLCKRYCPVTKCPHHGE